MAGPLLLIVLGLLLLLNNLFPESWSFSRLWPVVLIAIGAGKITEYLYRQKNKGER
jgi:hypothetical protein